MVMIPTIFTSLIFFIEKLQNVETEASGETTSPPPGSSTGDTGETTSSTGATSAPPATTSTLATSGQIESSSSASGSASELSPRNSSYMLPDIWEYSAYVRSYTFQRLYNFYTEQDVESLIKQIPDIFPYIDAVPEDEEPISKSRSLTKKELAKLTPEAKILNIASNKKAKEIKYYLLEKFDRVFGGHIG